MKETDNRAIELSRKADIQIFQTRRLTRSQTLDVVSSNGDSGFSSSPRKLSSIETSKSPTIPRKSPERSFQSLTQSFATASPKHNGNNLVRPITKPQTAPSLSIGHPTRLILQSSSSFGSGNTRRYKGNSPIRKADGNPKKLSHSVTSILTSTQDASGSTIDTEDSGGPSKISRFRTKKVFAKFTGVISDHFTTKSARRDDKVYSSTKSTRQIVNGLPLPRLPLASLPLPNQDISSSTYDSTTENASTITKKASLMTGRTIDVPSVARKRLTMVDEAVFQKGNPLEDPFSDSSSNHQSTEFGLKCRQRYRGISSLADPFQAERILETNVDAVLAIPPIGCSTPRRRPRPGARCSTPTRGIKDMSNDDSGHILQSPYASPTKSNRQRKISVICESPVTGVEQLETNGRDIIHGDSTASYHKTAKSSDSTRLSSYPPGSTIRHVPRSMGRLHDALALPAPTTHQSRPQSLARKKHPSPSKGQLEIYGKYMEKNLARGVFQDPDELGMSFEISQPSLEMLSPRDTNRLMRGPAISNIDLRKEYISHGNKLSVKKTRSRIPKPVKQISRSRTETVLARDFYPANKGDMTTEDELQWDSSAHRIGHCCNHCGSGNQL